MNHDFLLNFQSNTNFCRARREPETNKLIVEGKRRKKGRKNNPCITHIIEEFPDSEKGRKQCLTTYLEVFDKIFGDKQGEFKEMADAFKSRLNLSLFSCVDK
ncbi:hypothetical protein [Alteromonas macleodii]|uniref:hypothetical protein n=1 Tax=Alteromonas macleodii TaxID=28108 RepID=UPI0031406CDF|tara:strand:- start:28936 stop:29241 length:306 start_codon:yes stop_codon:yes gene_type:complete